MKDKLKTLDSADILELYKRVDDFVQFLEKEKEQGD